jgi:arabinogalactan oligomer/maltooligosaccharide transport system substrate-binding protein
MAGALVLGACAAPSSVNGETSDSGQVVYWDTSGRGEHPMFEKLAAQCAAMGGYRVNVEQVAFDQALNNFKTAAQGGQGPDVFRADVAWVAGLAENGLLVDLSGAVVGTDISDFMEISLGSTKYQGKTYAIPQVTDTLALFYNKKELAEAGITPPKTWDDLKAGAPKLGGQKAFFLNNDAYYALPFMYGEGGDLLDTAAKRIVISSEANMRGMGTAKALLDAKAAQTALDPSNSYNNMQAAFGSGQVAMVINGPWAVVDYLQADAFKADSANLGIAPVPGPTATTGSAPVGGHDYVIRQGTKARKSSLAFVRCMSSTASQIAVAKELGLLPSRKSAYEDPAVLAQPIVSAFVPALKQAHTRPWIPVGNQLFDALKISYADVLAGKKDARAALGEVAKAYKDQVVPDYKG